MISQTYRSTPKVAELLQLQCQHFGNARPMPYLLHISFTALAATLQSLAVLDFKLDSIQLRTIQWDNFPKQILCSPLYVAIFLYMATVTEKSWRT